VIENGRNLMNEVENEDEKTSYTCVMKFGGSSVASAERMMEVASLVLSFPEERPIVVLSAMGKTTNKLLLVFISLTFSFYYYNVTVELVSDFV
jgi:aspartate kinase